MFASDPNKCYENLLHRCIPPMHTVIPEGRQGKFWVQHMDITPEMAVMFNIHHLESSYYSGVDMTAEPGTTCSLLFDSSDTEKWPNGFGTMMSDTQMEKRTNRRVLRRAHGDVLIVGLGLGMILTVIPFKDSVRSVTVLELSGDVMNLILPPLHARAMKEEGKIASDFGKVDTLHANAFDWKPPKGKKYDCIYLDIWPDISTENLPEIAALKRRYAHWLKRDNPEAWMGAWVEQELRETVQREKHRERMEQERMNRMKEAFPEAFNPETLRLLQEMKRRMSEDTGYPEMLPGVNIVFIG